MRVLAALSGGVDSAVAAALAVEAGHDVTGVHLMLSYGTGNGCAAPTDAADAQRSAEILGIDLLVWDLSEVFERTVVADLVSGYAKGLTPNPCVRCNQYVKFAAVVDRAVSAGYDAVCTGHYAQVGSGQLQRAACEEKDQSYVIAVAGPDRLSRAMFPLGAIPNKAEVRAMASVRGLTVADKPESFDICFVPGKDLTGYLRQRLGPQPGQILDQDGDVLGRHEGTYGFTVGQRKGLRLGRPAADGQPRYVTQVRPERREVVVGPAAALDVVTFSGRDPVWFAPPGDYPCNVQVRAHAQPVSGRVIDAGHTVRIDLDQPIRGLAAGQSAVCYDDGGEVVVQATILPGGDQ